MERQTKSSVSARKIAGLDGFRGIAVIGVIGYHLIPCTLSGGFLGVNLFFVLSGYLMAVTCIREQAASGFRAGKFYWKRIVRIYPALILAVCATLFMAYFFTPDILYGVQREVLSIFSANYNWWQITQNMSYFTRITGTSPFTHLWSLAVEMQFYILWPVLFSGYMALRRHKVWGAGLFIILILVSVLALLIRIQPAEDLSRVYYGTDTRIFALLIGSLLGLYQKQLRKKRRRNKHIRAVVFFLLMAHFLWLYFAADGQSAITYRSILVPSAFTASWLIDLCADKRLPFGRRLDCSPLGWLGKRSYELYLIQYPVIFFVRRLSPAGSEAWNTSIALLFILLAAQWIHQVTVLVQNRKRSKHYGKTTLQNMGNCFPAAGSNCGGRRSIRITNRAGSDGKQRSKASPAGTSGECRAPRE